MSGVLHAPVGRLAKLICLGDVAGVRRDVGEGVKREDLDVGQVVGIAIAMGGLAAFLWLNQRGAQARRTKSCVDETVVPEGSVRPAVP